MRPLPPPPVVPRTLVYVVHDTKTGEYKIGFTDAMRSRMLTLLKERGGSVRLVWVFATDRPVTLERYLHGRFAHRRTVGEWFRLAPDDVAEICSVNVVRYGPPDPNRVTWGDKVKLFDPGGKSAQARRKYRIAVGEMIKRLR